MKPYEVEILVAQVGASRADDELFHILYDGTVMDEEGFTVLGGQAETITEVLAAALRDGPRLRAAATKLGAQVLGGPETAPPAPTSSRSRCSTANAPGARSAASRATSSTRSSRADSRPATASTGCATSASTAQ